MRKILFILPAVLLLIGAGCDANQTVSQEQPTSVAALVPSQAPVTPSAKEVAATAYDYKTDPQGIHFSVNGKPSFTMQSAAAAQFIGAAGSTSPSGVAVTLPNDPTHVYLATWRSKYNATTGEFLSTDTTIFVYSTKDGSLTKIYLDSNKQGEALFVEQGAGTKVILSRCNVDWSPGSNDTVAGVCPPGTLWYVDVANINAGLRSYNL